MARTKSENKKKNGSSANIGFEAKLWLAADKLRSNMDARGERGEGWTRSIVPKND